MEFTEKTTYKPNLEVFSNILQALASEDPDILVVTSDSRGSGKLVPFAERFPGQIIETGIAEQNMVGIAAGLASAGKKVFAVSPACFLSARSLEQIKNDVAYSDHPVKLIGISAGVSYGPLGSTHHSLHDFAVLRAIHNMIVCAPADNYETELAIRSAAETYVPLYIRLGKKPMPFVHRKQDDFIFGKGMTIRKGNDLAIIATGECVYPALTAATKLQEEGIDCTVVSMHTVKPLDENLLLNLAGNVGGIITVEEHSLFGGLGEACASILMENNAFIPFKRMAVPDEYTITGAQAEIFEHYGLTSQGIANEAIRLLNKTSNT